MTQYSYTPVNRIANATGSNKGGGRGTSASRPSESQIQFYLDMCLRKRVTPKDTRNLTKQEVGNMIEELQAYNPPSQKQVDLMKSLVKELIELGDDYMNKMPADFYQTCTFDKASSFIETLMKRRKKFNTVARPSEKQLQMIVEMFLCPDIAFEDYGVEKKLYLDHLNAYVYGHNTPDDVEKRAWRYRTPVEFAEEVKAKMSQADAAQFIDRYRGTYYKWKKNQISIEQVKYIRELENRLGNMRAPRTVQQNDDGDFEWTHIYTDTREQQNAQQGYTPMPEFELMQFDRDMANKWISMLRAEIEDVELYKFGEEADGSETFEMIREAKSKHQAKVREIGIISNALWALRSATNIKETGDDELDVLPQYDDIQEIQDTFAQDDAFFNGDNEISRKKKTIIRERMMFALDEGYMSFENLAEVCMGSDIMQDILAGRF